MDLLETLQVFYDTINGFHVKDVPAAFQSLEDQHVCIPLRVVQSHDDVLVMRIVEPSTVDIAIGNKIIATFAKDPNTIKLEVVGFMHGFKTQPTIIAKLLSKSSNFVVLPHMDFVVTTLQRYVPKLNYEQLCLAILHKLKHK
jgi:hypothetical protein